MISAAQAFRPLFVLIVLFCFAACARQVSEQIVRETDEPIFRRAKEMLNRDLAPEALINFSKLIIKRNGDAPESHLEVGLIYLNDISDPISAYYHFSKYKAIVSGEEDAELRRSSVARINELLKSARKDLLAQFPSEVYKDPLERIKLIDTIEALRNENNQLKDALTSSRNRLRELSSTPRYESRAGVEEPSAAETQPARIDVAEAPPSPSVEASPPPAKFYVVQQGDSLYKISRQVYGDGARWQEILNANAAILPSKDRLQPGMRLRIP